jgi:hypothetical protein
MKILLFRTNGVCPSWWMNYVMETNILHSDTAAINEGLKEYGATFSYTTDKQNSADERWLSFEHEYQYTWFILRWS